MRSSKTRFDFGLLGISPYWDEELTYIVHARRLLRVDTAFPVPKLSLPLARRLLRNTIGRFSVVRERARG